MSIPCRVATLVLGLTLLVGTSPQSQAAVEAPTVDAQVRVRENVLFNRDFDSNVDDPQNFARMRTRLGMTFEAGRHASAYIQFQDTRTLGEPASTTTSLEQTDLHQGYVQVRNAFDSDLVFQIGRMEMKYGAERQIGALGWSDVGRSFDGIRMTTDIEDFGWFHAFAMKLNEVDGVSTISAGSSVDAEPALERTLIGAYLHYDASEDAVVEAYALDVHANEGDLVDSGTGNTEAATGNLFTAGGRVDYRDADRVLRIYGEGAVQFGSAPQTTYGDAGADYNGYAAVAGIRYDLPTEVESWIGFEFNVASGDDGTDPTNIGTYQQLFPTGHPVLGHMDLVGWQNIRDFQGTLGFRPTSGWKLWGSYHYFQVSDPADSAYLADGSAWLMGDPTFDDTLGSEVDLAASFSPESNLSFLAQLGVWMPGSYQEQSMGGGVATPADLDTAVSLFLQTTATF